MSETFTPGPWKASGHDVHEMHGIVAYCPFIREQSECHANARLIAAAPDMYEALKAIDDLWSATAGEIMLDFQFESEFEAPLGLAWKKVRAALAKAAQSPDNK